MFVGGAIWMLGSEILLLHPKPNIRVRHESASRSNRERVIFVTGWKGDEVTCESHVPESFIPM
jgi:hypothetical protein